MQFDDSGAPAKNSTWELSAKPETPSTLEADIQNP